MERKKENISLKTNLNDIPINKNLRSWKCQNYSGIINIQKPNKPKNKLNISFIGLKNTLKNNSSHIKSNNITNDNFLQFTGNENFKMDFEGELSKSTNNIQGNTFKSLLNQNFSKYILILKKLYPLFKFNHYQKMNEHSNKENQIKKNRRNNPKNNKDYIQSTLLDILGLQENITIDPEKFLIKKDFLERTSLDELIMIKDDLVMKTGMIDKELNKIVAYNTNKIYIYIENNIIIGHKIDCYLFSMKGKRECKMNLKEKFIGNSAKLFLIENKKQNMIKIKNYFLEIKNIKDDFIKLDFIIEESESENKIQEISDLINMIRNKIKVMKNKDIFKSLKIISEMEKELINYENRGEEFLIIEFNKIINNLIQLCLVYDKKLDNKIPNEKIELKKTNFNLKKEIDKKNKDLFVDLDFEYENFDFMLIYNNIENNSKNIKIRNNLISIM